MSIPISVQDRRPSLPAEQREDRSHQFPLDSPAWVEIPVKREGRMADRRSVATQTDRNVCSIM